MAEPVLLSGNLRAVCGQHGVHFSAPTTVDRRLHALTNLLLHDVAKLRFKLLGPWPE